MGSHGPVGLLVMVAVALVVVGMADYCLTADTATTNDLNQLQSLHLQHESGPSALEIIKARGFIGELYTTLSRDLKPISIYHIINPLANQKTLNKYPVLIFHGISGDASQMLSHSEPSRPRAPLLGQVTHEPSDTALAFMMANNNFDVFMVDARGSNLNNHQVSNDLNIIQGQSYWNFTLDDQLEFDLPVILDFVLEHTHEDKLHYVGFSESTFFMFGLLSKHPEYQEKLASFVALAPVAYVAHIRGAGLTFLSPAALFPDWYNGNYIPQTFIDTVGTGLRKMCQMKPFTDTICASIMSGISGLGDTEQSHGFYSTTFKSTSIKSVKQFIQLYQQRRFGMYDYGPAGNMRQYGQLKPPNYELARIKMSTIVLFRGGNDFLSDHEDQQILLAELGTKPYLDVYYPGYNHIDFIMGRNVVKEINLPAAQAMFELLKWHVSQSGGGSILRDPAKALLPKRLKPVAVVVPDGSRELEIRSNLVNNLINGFVQTSTKQILPNDGGKLTATPVTQGTTSRQQLPIAFLNNVGSTVLGSVGTLLPGLNSFLG